MDIDDPQQKALLEQLQALHHTLRDHTRSQYNRINPFYEDLFQWKERGAYWLGEDKNVTIYNSTTVVGDVKIGQNTWIGPYCSLDGTGGLTIGSYCSISLGCQLLSHDTAKWSLSGGKSPYEYAATRIGDYCFLGTFAIVLKGITIGNRCLIAAGSVVTRDVPDNTIAAGTPARAVGTVRVSESGEVELAYGD